MSNSVSARVHQLSMCPCLAPAPGEIGEEKLKTCGDFAMFSKLILASGLANLPVCLPENCEFFYIYKEEG